MKEQAFQHNLVLPEFIDWEVTSQCNLKCRFCFGPEPEIYGKNELDTKQALAVVHKLATGKVRKVVITGGEPLLRRDINRIIKEISKLGMKIVLSTNGYLLEKKIQALSPFVEWFSLPIDGSQSSISTAMRGDPHHHLLTLDNIKLLNSHNKKIKIGTVVSKLNLNDLSNIAKLLQEHTLNVWKLYQFSPRGRGRVFKDIFEISQDEFLEVCRNLQDKYPLLNIVASSIESRNLAYCLILPEGKVVTPFDDHYLEIGDLLDENINFAEWEAHIDHNRMISNFNLTYPSE